MLLLLQGGRRRRYTPGFTCDLRANVQLKDDRDDGLYPMQERATKISHGNTARLASLHGDAALTKVCGLIAADEGRHESESSMRLHTLLLSPACIPAAFPHTLPAVHTMTFLNSSSRNTL